MYLFAFRSRTQSMKFYDLLRLAGVSCDIVNTPRDVSASCGLSVTVPPEYIERAESVYRYYSFNTALGIYYRDEKGYRRYS